MFDLEVSLERNEGNTSQTQEWWIVNQMELGPVKKDKKFVTGLEVYVFSDQVSPPSLGFLAGYGYVVTAAALVVSEKKHLEPINPLKWTNEEF